MVSGEVLPLFGFSLVFEQISPVMIVPSCNKALPYRLKHFAYFPLSVANIMSFLHIAGKMLFFPNI